MVRYDTVEEQGETSALLVSQRIQRGCIIPSTLDSPLDGGRGDRAWYWRRPSLFSPGLHRDHFSYPPRLLCGCRGFRSATTRKTKFGELGL